MTKTDATAFALSFGEITAGDLPLVGGKGANLGILARAAIPVPRGFCVTTNAYELFLSALPDAEARFAALDAVDGTSPEAARRAAESMRGALETLALPAPVASAVMAGWQALGGEHPLAVRSSATAEDLPGASFAGQQDTYLNIRGGPALLDAVKRCWISLFTDRAVLYRARNGSGHRTVKLSVVVQHLVEPDVSGILFTADPVSGHRQIASIDAGFGLGEALVGGLISADLYQVDRRRMKVLLARPGDKAFAIRSVAGGGTRREPLSPGQRNARCLADAQVLELVAMGGKIEALYDGVPQDIEWCIRAGNVYVVQARPITSLFPIPVAGQSDEAARRTTASVARSGGAQDGLHVFLSFGHFQMMLDAMPRLALEVWRLFFPVGKGGVPTLHDPPRLSAAMVTAAGRLFIDATAALRVPRFRTLFLRVMGLLYEALARSAAALTNRPEFAETPGKPMGVAAAAVNALGPVLARLPAALLVNDPVAGAARFTRALDELPAAARARILAARTPAARIRQCAVEVNVIFRLVRTHLSRVAGGLVAHRLLLYLTQSGWAAAVRDDAETLLRGLPGNVTTEMDLAVGDLSDLVRPYPALAALLRDRSWSEIRPALATLAGGPPFAEALQTFIDRYGDRGASEVDLSRPRWRDDPSLLLRVVAAGPSSGDAGAHRRKHQAQAAAAEEAAMRLTAAAGQGWAGPLRRWLVRRLIRVARFGLGLREHPKFIIVRLLGLVRAEVIAAGNILAQRNQLARTDQVWHLGFEELARALADDGLDLRREVAAREEQFRLDQKRRVPIVISSDGETPTLALDRADLPAGALPGTAASNGVVEGTARVVTDPASETIQAGEILVAPFTDPGWTPLFVHAAGLVTEVGGMMTHGAVVAREYGIPAVVSVEGAVGRIKTGQRIRVDGTRGFVEVLDPVPPG